MKKVLAMVMALVLMVGMCSLANADQLDNIKAAGVLKVGANVGFPPYEFYWTNPETGEEELAGFDMMIAQGLADELGVELQVMDQAFSGLITAVRANELDCAISGISIKPERLEVVDFSKPYFGGTQIMVIRTADADKYKTVADMAGATIGAQNGSLQQGILETQFAESNPLLLDSIALLATELYQGTIDGWLITDTVAKQYIALYKDQLMISEVPVVYDVSAGSGIAVPKSAPGMENEALLEVINNYIDKIKADGTFDAMLEESYAKAASLLEAE
ncbi:MAG: transporter substrate-binding domain-containing protein [Clostridia bacterium]|nr:transporter substrate-binding domain-containing protein [Clostridia bacterium]